jgi:hypothetical protein
MGVARAHGGWNTNLLSDDGRFDPVSNNAVLNGIPVEVSPAAPVLPKRMAAPRSIPSLS